MCKANTRYIDTCFKVFRKIGLNLKYHICRNKRPGRLIFRSNKKNLPNPIKAHQFCVLPPLKNHPSKPIGFVYSPLWKISVFGGRLFQQIRYALSGNRVDGQVVPTAESTFARNYPIAIPNYLECWNVSSHWKTISVLLKGKRRNSMLRFNDTNRFVNVLCATIH